MEVFRAEEDKIMHVSRPRRHILSMSSTNTRCAICVELSNLVCVIDIRRLQP